MAVFHEVESLIQVEPYVRTRTCTYIQVVVVTVVVVKSNKLKQNNHDYYFHPRSSLSRYSGVRTYV